MGPDGKLRKKRRYRRTKKQMQLARQLEEERIKSMGEEGQGQPQKPRGRGRPGRPPKNKGQPVSGRVGVLHLDLKTFRKQRNILGLGHHFPLLFRIEHLTNNYCKTQLSS